MQYKTNFHYTAKCDMKCNFCFKRIKSCEDERTILKSFERLSKRTKAVNLAGGEIFLNIPLLRKLVESAVKNNVSLSLITNGYELSNNIASGDVEYILENIDMLGISIDSFDENKLKKIGRAVNGETLNLWKLRMIAASCKKHRVALKLNTVVSKMNVNDNMINDIEEMLGDIKLDWKQLKVVTDSKDYSITLEEFNTFVENNKTTNKNINIKTETDEVITNSYVIVDSEGYYIYDQNKRYEDVSIEYIDSVEKLHKFNEVEYMNRYKREHVDVSVSKSFVRKLKDTRGTRMLFFDVEAFSVENEYKKVKKRKGYDYPFLWSAFLVDENLNIVNKFSSMIPKDKVNNPRKLYLDFYNILKREKVDKIVVSGGSLEERFLNLCLYYCAKEIPTREAHFFDKYKNKIFDIQDISSNGIEINGDEISLKSTVSIMRTFKDIYPEFLQYKRKTSKSSISSKEITFVAEDAYAGEIDFESSMNQIMNYCFDDIYDDFNLLKFLYRLPALSKFYSGKETETKKVNLHMHTINSDGTKTYKEVIDECKTNNVEVLSITNHDNIFQIEEMEKYATLQGIKYIKGIEISCIEDGREYHILGYGFDAETLKSKFQKYVDLRQNAAKQFIKKLKEEGYEFNIDIPYDKQIVTRGRLAEYLVKAELFETKSEVYKYIRSVGYDDVALPSVEEAIEIIRDSGGVPVMAHPLECIEVKTNKKIKVGLADAEKNIIRFKSYGLEGIEVYYYDYQFDKQLKLKEIAEEQKLVITGGTDYHGKENRDELYISKNYNKISLLSKLN